MSSVIFKGWAGGWIAVDFAYDEEVKDELKDVAGPGNYRYRPESKLWIIRPHVFDAVREMFEEYDYEIIDRRPKEKQQPPPPTSTSSTQGTWIAIFNSLEPEIAKRLYRAATQVLHPDKGGTNEAMQQLNDAYQMTKRG